MKFLLIQRVKSRTKPCAQLWMSPRSFRGVEAWPLTNVTCLWPRSWRPTISTRVEPNNFKGYSVHLTRQYLSDMRRKPSVRHYQLRWRRRG